MEQSFDRWDTDQAPIPGSEELNTIASVTGLPVDIFRASIAILK
jgi:hypothetical protein